MQCHSSIGPNNSHLHEKVENDHLGQILQSVGKLQEGGGCVWHVFGVPEYLSLDQRTLAPNREIPEWQRREDANDALSTCCRG